MKIIKNRNFYRSFAYNLILFKVAYEHMFQARDVYVIEKKEAEESPASVSDVSEPSQTQASIAEAPVCLAADHSSSWQDRITADVANSRIRVPCGMVPIENETIFSAVVRYADLDTIIEVSSFKFLPGSQYSIGNIPRIPDSPDRSFILDEPVIEEILPAVVTPNRNPTSQNYSFFMNEDDIPVGGLQILPSLLSQAFDPDVGDVLSIVNFGFAEASLEIINTVSVFRVFEGSDLGFNLFSASYNFEDYFSLSHAVGTGVYIITYLNDPSQTARLSIDESGQQIIEDFGALQHLAQDMFLNLRIHFTVGDQNGGLAKESYVDLQIQGKNDGPMDDNEQVLLNVEDILGDVYAIPNLLDNAKDIDIGDYVSFAGVHEISLTPSHLYTIQQIGEGAYEIIYVPHPSDKIFLSIAEDGSLHVSDGGGLKYLAKEALLSLKIYYTVTDSQGALNESVMNLDILGKNDKPEDPNECAAFTEDQIIEGVTLEGFKLEGAFDPDGDHVHIQTLLNREITAQIDGSCVGHLFTSFLCGDVITVRFNDEGDLRTVLQLKVNFENGTEVITSKDDDFWNRLGVGDYVHIKTYYTVADPYGATDDSYQMIKIIGQNDGPVIDSCTYLGSTAIGNGEDLNGNIFVKGHASDIDGDSLHILTVNGYEDGHEEDADDRSGYIGIRNDFGQFTINIHTGNYVYEVSSESEGGGEGGGEPILFKYNIVISDGYLQDSTVAKIELTPPVNYAPTDSGERILLGVEDIIYQNLSLPNLLSNSFDRDGDILQVSHIGSVTISRESEYSITPTSVFGSYVISYLGVPNEYAYIDIDRNGTLHVRDEGALKYLADDDELAVGFNYILSDGNGGFSPGSQLNFFINGANHAPEIDSPICLGSSIAGSGNVITGNLYDIGNAFDYDNGLLRVVSINGFEDNSANDIDSRLGVIGIRDDYGSLIFTSFTGDFIYTDEASSGSVHGSLDLPYTIVISDGLTESIYGGNSTATTTAFIEITGHEVY